MKQLVIEVRTNKSSGKIYGRIIVQSDRGISFAPTGTFYSRDGFKLCSSDYPDLQGASVLYVRGRSNIDDTKTFSIPDERTLDRLRLAVKEYNEFYRDINNERTVITL